MTTAKIPNKETLVALIMANTDEFKKTHLMLKPVTEVREIAAQYLPAEEPIEEAPEEPAPAKPPKVKELNDTQKLLIEAMPLLPDFKDTDSIVKGKDLLAKVNELHDIPPKKTGAVMVSLKNRGYFKLVGKKSGQKIVTVQLLPLAIEFLGLNKKGSL